MNSKIILLLAAFSLSIHLCAQKTASDYRPAAEQGDTKAQYNLGVCYYKGAGVPKDYVEGARWIREAAEKGHVEAQYTLGISYENGLGVPKDNAEAVRWFRRAAEQGYARAQNNLGNCYYHGIGVPKDYAEAARWFRQAADKGHAEAQYSLGTCYDEGEGVRMSKNTALYWYEKALANKENLPDKFRARCTGKVNLLKQRGYSSTLVNSASASASGSNTGTASRPASNTDTASNTGSGSVSRTDSASTSASNTNPASASNTNLASGSSTASTSVSSNPSTTKGAKAITGKIKRAWVEPLVYQGATKGIRIHVRFTVQDMLDVEGLCAVYFYDKKGVMLKDTNEDYNTSEGQVAVHDEFTPSSQKMVYKDFTLFIPYDELHLPRGRNKLIFHVELLESSAETWRNFAISRNVRFALTNK